MKLEELGEEISIIEKIADLYAHGLSDLEIWGHLKGVPPQRLIRSFIRIMGPEREKVYLVYSVGKVVAVYLSKRLAERHAAVCRGGCVEEDFLYKKLPDWVVEGELTDT